MVHLVRVARVMSEHEREQPKWFPLTHHHWEWRECVLSKGFDVHDPRRRVISRSRAHCRRSWMHDTSKSPLESLTFILTQQRCGFFHRCAGWAGRLAERTILAKENW